LLLAPRNRFLKHLTGPQFVNKFSASKIKTYPKKLKLILKNTRIDKTLTYASETPTLTKRDRNQLSISERKVYRRILGPVYGNEKENWRILTNKCMQLLRNRP
jgi:hypothetical protein